MRKLIVLISFALIFPACEKIENWLNGEDNLGITQEEVVEGLKTALKIGTDTATSVLSVVNGYYGNPLMKIPLPENVQFIREKVTGNALAGFFNLNEKIFEDIVKSINRAAENAAKEAGPIFKNAITSMTLIDAMEILKGRNPLSDSSLKSAGAVFDSTAATAYFKVKTYDSLFNLYAPKINNVLDKDLGLGFSANEAWEKFTTGYNNGLNLINSNFITDGLDEEYGLPSKITDNLGEFSTNRALTGLFIKVGEEEKKIRENPYDWAVNIIRKVFGYIKDNPEG